MKPLLAVVALIAALPLMAPPARSQDLRPDLAITAVTASTSRVAVGESFEYMVTARNNGRSPCNWLNISMALPGAVNLTSTRTPAPLSCAASAPVRVIGEPMVEICRGGPGFFLWPGRSVTMTYVVQALRAASGVVATATVDPGNVCFESRKSNNRGTSPPVTLFKRPQLVMSLNPPGDVMGGGGRGRPTQVFPVTIANRGEGPAIDVALAVSHTDLIGSAVVPALPELLTAYKGALIPEGQMQPTPIAPACSNFSASGVAGRICSFRVTLQPTEELQARYRFFACPSGGRSLPIMSDIRVTTADDVSRDNHRVSLHDACRL